jgi:hypothetical protein
MREKRCLSLSATAALSSAKVIFRDLMLRLSNYAARISLILIESTNCMIVTGAKVETKYKKTNGIQFRNDQQ